MPTEEELEEMTNIRMREMLSEEELQKIRELRLIGKALDMTDQEKNSALCDREKKADSAQ